MSERRREAERKLILFMDRHATVDSDNLVNELLHSTEGWRLFGAAYWEEATNRVADALEPLAEFFGQFQELHQKEAGDE